MNAVIGFSEVLTARMYGDLNEKQDEYLNDIHAPGTHLLSLINDILDLSKIEAGRMELEVSDFDLPAAIDNALTLVRERAGRRSISLQTAIDPHLGQIGADERKLKQILLNPLSNAIKFTPEGGRIEVTAAPVDGYARVAVSDTGIGIAAQDLDAVFRGVPASRRPRQEGGGDRPRAGALLQVRRAARRADLGREPAGRRLDVHVHDPGAAGLTASPHGQPISSTSTNTNSRSPPLNTSCSTPAERK